MCEKMKPLTLFLISLCLAFYSFSQEGEQYANLSYDELDSLFYVFYEGGKYSDATPYANAYIHKAEVQRNDTLRAYGLNFLGRIQMRMGDYDSALLLFEPAKDIIKNRLGNEHPSYAQSLEYLGLLYVRIGDYSRALPLLLQCIDITEKAYSEEHVFYTTSLNNLALLHVTMDNHDQALPLLLRANEINERVVSKEHASYATSLSNLGSLYQIMGKYDQALPLLLQASEIRGKTMGKEHNRYAYSLGVLASLYMDMGNYSNALPLYLQAKAIEEKALGQEHSNYATRLNNLALLYKTMGSYNLALPLLLQSKDIKEKSLGKDHPNYANSLDHIGDLYVYMGHYDQALSLYLQSKDIREKALGKQHRRYAASLTRLSKVYEQMGHIDEALSLNLEALEIEKKIVGIDHPIYAGSLNNLAGLYQQMGDYERTLQLYLESANIREKVLGKEHPSYIQSLNNLASLYSRMGKVDKAWEVLNQAMRGSCGMQVQLTFDKTWFDRLLAASYSSYVHLERMIESLEIAYQLMGSNPGANDARMKQSIVTDLANALLVKARNQVSNEQDKLRILSLSHDWLLRGLNSLDPEIHAEQAFKLADQNKSVLLLQASMSELAYQVGGLPDSLIWRERELLKKQSELQVNLLGKLPDAEEESLRDQLNHINQDIDVFVRMIEHEYPKYHEIKYRQVDASVSEIQASQEPNTALLEYVVGDSAVHVFYVDQEQLQWSRLFVGNEELNNRINSLHRSLSDYQSNASYQAYSEQAHWFYQNLVAQSLKDKGHINKLIIVTDGELGHLPFEAFLVDKSSDEPHYLLNDYNISYTYSATLWKENMEAPNPQNNGEIFGVAADYNLMPDSSMLALRMPPDQWTRGELTALPAARKEVETLQAKYEGFFAFDSLASERVVKEKASDYSILHFATHGILNKEQPVLSSLAFTEDSDSTESNFWQAHEISQAQLNADLVVLSACETGYGEFERGNGIASLARAFMYAGAPSLVVSLWQVNDEATSELMKNFYDNLDMGMKKDEALREAKLQYIKSADGVLAHPAFWSPFIVMGKTDPVEIKKKHQPITWGYGLAMLALMGIGGLIFRRKAA